MGYAKERGKFELLAIKVSSLKFYDEKSLAIITDIYEQFSHSLRILKNKNPEAFITLYQNELEQVKLAKQTLKQSEETERQENFIKFKDVLTNALDSAITTSKDVS